MTIECDNSGGNSFTKEKLYFLTLLVYLIYPIFKLYYDTYNLKKKLGVIIAN